MAKRWQFRGVLLCYYEKNDKKFIETFVIMKKSTKKEECYQHSSRCLDTLKTFGDVREYPLQKLHFYKYNFTGIRVHSQLEP
jgi:hypothetical protein